MSRRWGAIAAFIVVTSLVGADEVAKDEPIVVVGRLVDIDGRAPDCGMYAFAMVMKYRVLRVEHGSLAGKWLYAIHACPEMTRTQYNGAAAGSLGAFVVGDAHRLTLVSKVPPEADAAVIDLFTKQGKRWWVARADKVDDPEAAADQ